MKQRTLTSVVLALLSMVLLGCFHLPWVPQLIAILLGCGAVWEILGANGIRNKGSYAAGLFLAVIIPLFSLTEKVWWMAAALVLGLGFFTYLMTRIDKQAPAWVAAPEIVLALSLYRGLACYGEIPHGAFFLCLTGLICALTDIFAYLVGSRFGVKDFGHIFPGHGGILDRCDSLMYPLAFTWLLYCAQIWIFV